MFLPSRSECARDGNKFITVNGFFRISESIINRSTLNRFGSEIVKTVCFDSLQNERKVNDKLSMRDYRKGKNRATDDANTVDEMTNRT